MYKHFKKMVNLHAIRYDEKKDLPRAAEEECISLPSSAASLQLVAFPNNRDHIGDRCVAEETPWAIQEMPCYTAKTRPVMAWLEESIWVARVTDAAAVFAVPLLKADTQGSPIINCICSASDVFRELF